MQKSLLVVVFFFGCVLAQAQSCPDNDVCFIKVKGAVCADGSQTGFSVTYRPGAKNLFIFFDGGGACWNEDTCKKGTATNLSQPDMYEGNYFKQDLSGWRDLRNPDNPVAENYNLVEIPYCTGDIFIGNKITNHGTEKKPYVLRHVGYQNITYILEEISHHFESPEHIFLMGSSAGGLGASWNIHQVRNVYPSTKLFVLNDGGLLFSPPFVDAAKLREVFGVWGVENTSPVKDVPSEQMTSTLVKYNREKYPDISYGFISSYRDYIMSFFSKLLRAPNFTTAVKQTMISLAENEFAGTSKYNVFYLRDFYHAYAKKNPANVTSLGVSLSSWAKAMLREDSSWENIRPDLKTDL